MGYIGFAPRRVAVGEFTIGSQDVDARAQGVATVGRGGVIQSFVVLSGSGSLVYVDDNTGAVCALTGLAPGSDVEPEGGLAIRSINGTSNAAPSAAFTLRATW